MDWIDVLWTIAITEALLLRGGIFFVFCFSSQGFHSPCRLISSLFLFFWGGVSVLQRMTANYSAESHIGASKSKGGEGRGASVLQVVARNCVSGKRFGSLNSDKCLRWEPWNFWSPWQCELLMQWVAFSVSPFIPISFFFLTSDCVVKVAVSKKPPPYLLKGRPQRRWPAVH